MTIRQCAASSWFRRDAEDVEKRFGPGGFNRCVLQDLHGGPHKDSLGLVFRTEPFQVLRNEEPDVPQDPGPDLMSIVVNLTRTIDALQADLATQKARTHVIVVRHYDTQGRVHDRVYGPWTRAEAYAQWTRMADGHVRTGESVEMSIHAVQDVPAAAQVVG